MGIVKKIDRILVNTQFISMFKGVKGTFLPRGTSDHCPDVVKFAEIVVQSKYSFKFQNYLAYRRNFVELVDNAWRPAIGGVRR